MRPGRSAVWVGVGVLAAGCTLFPDRPVELTEPVEVVHADGLAVLDEFPGRGTGAGPGDTLVLEYELFVEGEPDAFESSQANGDRLEVCLGEGDLLPAMERGLLGIAVEGRRRLRIPPELAFGDEGVPGIIPPGATIVGHFELLELRGASASPLPDVGSGEGQAPEERAPGH